MDYIFPRNSTISRKIVWKNIAFHFDKNKQFTKEELWLHWINITKETINLFNKIINSNEIKKISYYNDRPNNIQLIFLKK